MRLDTLFARAAEAQAMLSAVVVEGGRVEISELDVVNHVLLESAWLFGLQKPVVKIDEVVKHAAYGLAIFAKEETGGVVVPHTSQPALDKELRKLVAHPLQTASLFTRGDFVVPLEGEKQVAMVEISTVPQMIYGLLLGLVYTVNAITAIISTEDASYTLDLAQPKTFIPRLEKPEILIRELPLPIPFRRLSIKVLVNRAWEALLGIDLGYVLVMPIGLVLVGV